MDLPKIATREGWLRIIGVIDCRDRDLIELRNQGCVANLTTSACGLRGARARQPTRERADRRDHRPRRLNTWPHRSRAIVWRERAHAGAQLSFTAYDEHRFQPLLTDQPD
jgi:hypothetical protein